jgi:hypothetical protein
MMSADPTRYSGDRSHTVMRIVSIVLLIQLLAGGLYAQSASTCSPPDSAPVLAWHRIWDSASVYSAEARRAQSRIIALPVWPAHPAPVDRSQVFGRYSLVAVLVGQGGTDWVGAGELRFAPPNPETLGRHEANQYFNPERMISGILTGSSLTGAVTGNSGDSVMMEGVFDPLGKLDFSPGLGTEDGGGFTATEWSYQALRGWWNPPGAVDPPQLGYFCATRLK